MSFAIINLNKELEQTNPYYVNRLMTKGVIRDTSCKPLGDPKIVLFMKGNSFSCNF